MIERKDCHKQANPYCQQDRLEGQVQRSVGLQEGILPRRPVEQVGKFIIFGMFGSHYRLSPSPPILPRSWREDNFSRLCSATSSSEISSSVLTWDRYHSTSPSSPLRASRSAALISPDLSRKIFLIFPATSPASLVSPRVGYTTG